MNNTQTLTLRNDYLFKLLLGSEENKVCLQDFLECILDIPTGAITDLELLDKELTKDTITDKTGILDVKLRLKDETTIDIEIQNSWSAEFIPRTLFYWSKMYIEGFKEGEPYTSLTRCITINLVSQGFKFNKAVHSAYGIQEQNSHQSLTDLLELHFLNLTAVKKAEIQQKLAPFEPHIFIAVNRHQIGHALEGVIRNAQRHQDAQRRILILPAALQQRQEKIHIFEKRQIQHRQQYACREPSASSRLRLALRQTGRNQRNPQRKRQYRHGKAPMQMPQPT